MFSVYNGATGMLKNLAQDDANSNSKSQSLFDGVDQPSALPVSVYIRY